MRKSGLGRSGHRILGHLYEIVVYRDVPEQTLRCLGRVSWDSLLMGRQLLAPCLWFSLPCLIILISLQACQDRRPFFPGEACLLSVRVEDGDLGDVRLELPDGLSLDAPPVRSEERHEVYWRLRAQTPGAFEVGVIRTGSDRLTKSLVVALPDSTVLLRQAREKPWYSGLLTPGEANLPGNAWLGEIRLDYPPRVLWLGDYRVSWLVYFLLAFLASGGLLAWLPLGPRR